MEISYKNRKWQKMCQEESIAKQELGKDSANQLKAKLNELDEAENVLELVNGTPHRISGLKGKYANLKGQYSLRLAHGNRLVFRPDHDPVPRKETGEIHWGEVTSVMITFIGDYHHG